MKKIIPGKEAFGISLSDTLEDVISKCGKYNSIEQDGEVTCIKYPGATIVLVKNEVESIVIESKESGKMENGICVGMTVLDIQKIGAKLEYNDDFMCWELSGVEGISIYMSRPKGANDFTDRDRVTAELSIENPSETTVDSIVVKLVDIR